MNQPIVYAIVAMICYSFSDFVYKQAATAGIRADATIFLLRSVAGGQASVLIPIAQMGFVTAPLGMFILRERVTVRKAIGLIMALAALAALVGS